MESSCVDPAPVPERENVTSLVPLPGLGAGVPVVMLAHVLLPSGQVAAIAPPPAVHTNVPALVVSVKLSLSG
jgi:TctA family transporter